MGLIERFMTIPAMARALATGAAVAFMVASDALAQVAQPPATGRPQPPVRDLGAVVATTPFMFSGTVLPTFGLVLQVVPVSDGRVIVSDVPRRIAMAFDTLLRNPIIVIDSAAGRHNSFSPASFMTSFRGDSALFFDRAAGAFVVIEPSGTLGRVFAPPVSGPLFFAAQLAMPVSSRTLGLVYRAPFPLNLPRPAADEPPVTLMVLDSAYLISMDYESRRIDTLATLSSGTGREFRLVAGAMSIVSREGPLFPFYDEAVVTTDGSIAVFRAREYRIDWINPDGSRTVGPRLDYPWRRITDEERQGIIDSVNRIRQLGLDSALARRAADSSRTGSPPVRATVVRDANGEPVTRYVPIAAPQLRPATVHDVPDYRPPTGRAAVLADADNNIWIRPILPGTGSVDAITWYVYDRQGELIDRVRVPNDRAIAGFGPEGTVYLLAHDAGSAQIQKVRMR